MPFGMVSGVGRGMGVLDEGGDRRRGSSGGEFGDFVTWLFPNYFAQDLLPFLNVHS